MTITEPAMHPLPLPLPLPRPPARPPTPPLTDDPRWQRILARDAGADGMFWYSVATTGVYCRPSCPSRDPNPANVALHDTLADARATGFRACRRCDPDGPGRAAARTALIAAACRRIEAADDALSLATLAAEAGLSAAHFHRSFKAATGLTPRGYGAARRAERMRAGLAAGEPVTQALHGAGFASHDAFHRAAPTALGMPAARYRRGGAGETLRYATGISALGRLIVAASATGVAAILFGEDDAALVADLGARFPAATLVPGDAAFGATMAAAIAMIDRPGTTLALPLDIRGTVFQQRVWQALAAIPAGETASYAQVAERIGTPAAVRAVAAACAANTLAVAIPCHRVVRSDGGLSGYRWGVARKRDLLDREAGAVTGPGDSKAGT